MKKKARINLLLFLASATIAAGIYKRSQSSLFQGARELSFGRFISENTGEILSTPCDYNLFFLVSPFDCQICSERFLTRNFVNNLKAIGLDKSLSVCINYVVTGDYSDKEKIEYISDIRNEITTYIDKKNMAKTFLLKKYGTIRTPFLIILTKGGEIKYYQDFEPDEKHGYQYVDTKLVRLLDEML